MYDVNQRQTVKMPRPHKRLDAFYLMSTRTKKRRALVLAHQPSPTSIVPEMRPKVFAVGIFTIEVSYLVSGTTDG